MNPAPDIVEDILLVEQVVAAMEILAHSHIDFVPIVAFARMNYMNDDFGS